MKIHKWSEPKASAARGNLGYSKKRKLLSPSKQQRTKPRIYKRQQCPMTGCFKEHSDYEIIFGKRIKLLIKVH